MIEYKRKYRLFFKTIAIVLVCLFIVNDVVFAAPAPYTSPKTATLATPTELPDSEFRAKFKVMEVLLAHDAVNNYIKTQIEKEKVILDKVWERQKTSVPDINDPAIRGRIKYSVNGLNSVRLVSITGLLAHTGQVAHVGLSGKDYGSVTVIYIDSQLFNDPQNTIQKHEIDEILQWENLRVNILHLEDKAGMRGWIKAHIGSADERLKGTEFEGKNARQIAKIFHERSYPVEYMKKYVNRKDFDYEYISLMLSLYGLDEESNDVNIAAREKADASSPPSSSVDVADAVIEGLLKRRDWKGQVLFLEGEFKNKDASTAFRILLAILQHSTYITGDMCFLNMAEKMRLFGKALSLSILGQSDEERKKMLWMLEKELLETPDRFEPEAVLLAKSYIYVANADVKEGTKVSTVISCHGEQDAIRVKSGDSIYREGHYIGDDDFLRTRIEQLKDLYAVNKNFDWELILVGDGDDRDSDDAARQEKTVNIARRIVETEYNNPDHGKRIKIIELSDKEKKKIGSQKGGATCLGMREAMNGGADYIFFVNAVPAYHAGQEGLLLQELLCGADMAIGSRKTRGAISKRSWIRELESTIYSSYVKVMLPWTRGISDTQAGFKAFTRQGLEDIIPVKEKGEFDSDFDYGLSFDSDLISRCMISNKGVIEVPVARLNIAGRISRAASLINILKMILGVIKQKTVFLERFKKRFENNIGRFVVKDDNGRKSYKYRMFRDGAEVSMIRVEGLSLHEGERSVIIIRKTGADHNYISQPTSLGLASAIRGTIGHLEVKAGDSDISTMEHLNSAIEAAGLTGLEICLYGRGCPILDGSAMGWLELFEEAGWVNKDSLQKDSCNIQAPIVLVRKRQIFREILYALKDLRRSWDLMRFMSNLFRVFFREDGHDICPIRNIILPPEQRQSDEQGGCYSEYIAVSTLPYMPAGSRSADFTYTSYEEYKKEIAPARTFVPFPLWERQAKGLFLGAIPGTNILTLSTHKNNRENRWSAELRFSNEPTRHKIEDIIGDMYLAESEMGKKIDVKGMFVGIGNGHRDNIEAGMMMKLSVDIAAKGTARPLMANVAPDGTLGYVEYDTQYVLKELRRLYRKGYLEEGVYNKIVSRLKRTHGTLAVLKPKTIVKNALTMSIVTGLLLWFAVMSPSNISFIAVTAVSLFVVPAALYHIVQAAVLICAKLSHNLNGIFGIPTKLNNGRAGFIKRELNSAGAGSVIFSTQANIQGLACTRPGNTVEIADWILDDTDYGTFKSLKGLAAALIAGLNYILKEALVGLVILDYEKTKQSWNDDDFLERHSYLLHPYAKIAAKFKRGPKARRENIIATAQYQKGGQEIAEKARRFLSQYDYRSWRGDLQELMGSLATEEDVAGSIIALSSKEVVDGILKSKRIDDSEYENILSKAFSLALRPDAAAGGRNRKTVRDALEPLSTPRAGVRSEAQKMAASYINIFDLKKKINVTTLFAMYREHRRIRPAAEGGEDFLRNKIEHLEDLSGVNADNFKWELVMVNDGDDSAEDPSPANKRTSLEMARAIAKNEYSRYIAGGQIRFFQLPADMRAEMNGRKGGAIMYGIWARLRQARGAGNTDHKPDIFILTDADKTVPLSFEGLLIPSVFDGGVGMAIGSAQKDVMDVRRASGLRQMIYRTYNRVIQWKLRELRGVQDTMMGFKAARTGVLEAILPFPLDSVSSTHPRLDPTFVPRGSFDDDMLCRIRAAGFEIDEIPVTWVHSEGSSFGFKGKVESIYDSLWKVPIDIGQYRKRLVDVVEKWLVSNNDYQRWRIIGDMVGSSVDSDKAATFLLPLLGTDIYKRRSISKHLDKERKQAQGRLTKQERVELLSHAISLFLRRSDGQRGYDAARLGWLQSILKDRCMELLPESRILIESYVDICNTGKKKVAMVSHLFASHRKVISDRLEQMQDIVFINPDIDWSFYWVTQADAGPGYAGSMREAKDAISLADPMMKAKIHITEVSHEELSRIQSVKGGSLVIGMAESLKDNPDYVLCSDMSLVPNLAQSGAIIGSLVRNSDNLAIASRRLPRSVGRRVWFRRMFSYALNKWIWLHHQNLRVINDSQAGLKGFTAQQLRSILPVRIDDKGNRIYDYTFDYGLSADVALMARAVKHGYGISEIPIIDTFEMSPKLTDHPLPKLYGKRVKREIVIQARAAEDFDGTWQFLGQGGEYQTFSHPSLNVVLQVPRRTNGFMRAFLTSGGDIAETTGRSTAMKVASLLLKTSPTRAFFYWYLHHSIRKNHSEERKRLAQIRGRLGGLVVPFDIIENPAVNVFYSYKHAFFASLRHSISWITYPVRWMAGRAACFVVNRFLAIQKSMPEGVFKVLSALVRTPIHALVWTLRTFYGWIASALRGLAKIWPFRPLITYIRNFLKLDRPGIFLIYPVKFFRWLNKWHIKISNFVMERIGFIPDHVSSVSRAIKTADMATRPLWKNAFKVTDAARRLVRITVKPERLEPEFALIKDKIMSFGDVLLRLDRNKERRAKGLKETEELIERFIEFQKSLWRRGAFDYESHLLGDIGIDAGGNIVISDLGVITFDLDEALQKLRPENKGRDFMTQEVLRQALSSELYDHYIKRIREEVTEENIRKLWRTDVDSCGAVSPPVGIPGNSFIAVTEEEKIARLYEELIKIAKTHSDERASEYLDSSDDKTVIATKVILRALRKGGWEERKIATEIAETVGRILSLSSYIKAQIVQNSLVNWEEALDRFLKGTPAKILLGRYFKASLISKTALESIFINTILDEYVKAGIVGEDKVNSILQQYGQSPQGSSPLVGSRIDTFSGTISYAEHAPDGVKLREAPDMKSIDAYIVNAGEGKRQGVLGIQSGTKGDIVFLGRRMKEWSARSSRNMSRMISDERRRPVLFSPTDAIYLKPQGDERAHLEDALVSDKPVVFFSPQDKVLKSDLSRPFSEDVGELVMEALFKIPGVGRKVVHKLIIPYLKNTERNELTENHGGYDFPGSWVVQPGRLMEAADLFGYRSEKAEVAWWVGMRLPLRVRERLWANMREELSTGFTEDEWMTRRNKVRDFVIESGGAHARTLVRPWVDCNTPLDIFNIYRGIVARSDLSWRRRLRETFEIEEDADIIDSQINGNYQSRGNFFINNSRILIAPGVTLELGNDVVIDNSLIEITGNPGDRVVMPDGTVISYSNISGQAADFAGSGRENFLHGVYSKNGFSFTGDKLVSATVILKGDEGPRTISQEFEFTSSGNVSLPKKEEIDLGRTEEILKLKDLLGPVRNKAPPAPELAQKPVITAKSAPSINIISPDNLPEGVITVTGGTGFIASNLCEALIEDGVPVAATVRSGSTNFSNLPQNGNINPVEFDLNNPDYNDLSTLVKRSKVVYHLGALGNQALATDLPAEAYVSNALTTGILAALCDQFDKRLLFSSTFVVYDFGTLKEGEEANEDMVLPDPLKYPIHARWLDEAERAFDRYVSDFIANKGKMDRTPLEFVSEHLLKNPLPPADYRMLGQNYPLSKLLAERLVLKRRSGIVMRVNNVYGLKQPEETMVPFFIKGIIAAIDGSTFTVWPTKRDIAYVKDLVKVMRRLEDASIPPNKRIVNLASGNFVSAKELADTTKDILGIEDKQDWTGEGVKIRTDEKKRKDLMPSLRLSDKRIRGLTGQVDFTPLRDGLKTTTEYYLSKNLAGCTPEHLLDVLKEEFKGGPATVYQIIGRKRYPKATVLRALRILEEKGLVSVNLDRGIRTYSVVLGENDRRMHSEFDHVKKYEAEQLTTQNNFDIENALHLMDKIIPSELERGRVYEIRYDSARLREYQRHTGISGEFSPEALLKAYIQCLQIRMPCKDPKEAKEAIKLIESPTRGDKERELISVTCYHDRSKTKLIGEGHVNIKGDLQGQTLRIIGMLNMALTASNVPNNISQDELSEYGHLISLIQAQYKDITGKELVLENLLQAMRFIELPSAVQIPVNNTEEYYRLTILQLQRAA